MSEDYLKLYADNLGNASAEISLNNLSTQVSLSDQLTPQSAIQNFLSGGSSPEQIDLENPYLDSDDSIFQADTLISSESVFPLSSATNTHEHQLGSPVDTLIGNQLSPTLEKAFIATYNHLKTLVSEPDFISKMNVAFGNSWNLNEAKTLLPELSQGNALPALAIVSSTEINGANGAFESVTNTIYLSSEYIAQNANDPEAIADVVLEEIGHYIDSQINTQDSAGDEGAIFSALVQGKILDEPELLGLKVEDDTTNIWRDGKEISIEMSQIALESLNGRLYQSHRGLDNNIYTRSSVDGVNWTGWNNNGGGQTLNAPTLEAFNGRLYQSHRGLDNNIYTRSSVDGVNWTGWNNNGGGQTPSPLELEAFNNRLYQSHRGLDNNIYTRSSVDGVNWTGWNNNGGGQTPSAPEIEAFNGRLYQSHQGLDNKIYTRSSIDGINWTGWVERGGLTPNDSDSSVVQNTGNPDIDIRLNYFGNFTQTQKNLIEKAAQNWERMITRDMVSSGVLNIAVSQGTTRMNGLAWGVWAETSFPGSYPPGTLATPKVRHNLPTSYDNQLGIDYHTRMHFNSNILPTLSSNWLVRLATHEIGHALYLDEAQYDKILGLDSVMDSGGLDQKITTGIYQRLEYLGYGVDRTAPVYWS